MDGLLFLIASVRNTSIHVHLIVWLLVLELFLFHIFIIFLVRYCERFEVKFVLVLARFAGVNSNLCDILCMVVQCAVALYDRFIVLPISVLHLFVLVVVLFVPYVVVYHFNLWLYCY